MTIWTILAIFFVVLWNIAGSAKPLSQLSDCTPTEFWGTFIGLIIRVAMIIEVIYCLVK